MNATGTNLIVENYREARTLLRDQVAGLSLRRGRRQSAGVHRHRGGEAPDPVLMDIQRSGMNGDEWRRMPRRPGTASWRLGDGR